MCDCLVALGPATGSGSTLFAKASDRPPGEAQLVEWLPPRRDRGPVRTTYMEVEAGARPTIGVLGSRPWWMWGLEHGVNAAGVAIGNEAIFTRLDPRAYPARLTGMDLVRLGLERAETARAAVEVMVSLLERYGQGGSGHHGEEHPYWSSFLVVDSGDAWVLETSGPVWETEQVRRTRAISNRTTIAAFDVAHRDPDLPTEVVTDPRLRASQSVLGAEPVTVASLEEHLRDHRGESGFSVCMHVPGYMATTAAVVAELTGPFESRRPLARVCLGSPCASVFVPVVVGRGLGQPPEWRRFAALAGDGRDALASLEAELERAAPACADSDGWAADAWRRVEELLPQPPAGPAGGAGF